jgi:hypothetical protein
LTENITRKIAALLNMTRAAGCSEAEAIAAAEKAAQMMSEHGLSQADVLFSKSTAPAKSQGRGIRDRLWGSLSVNTNTALVFTDGSACFVGQGPGPEIAAYLFTVLNRSIDKEVATFKATSNYRRRTSVASKRRAIQDFTYFMVIRLEARLRELFFPVQSTAARAAAVEARQKMFPNLQSVKPAKAMLRNKFAGEMGYGAGGRVQSAHAVGGQADRLQIGT